MSEQMHEIINEILGENLIGFIRWKCVNEWTRYSRWEWTDCDQREPCACESRIKSIHKQIIACVFVCVCVVVVLFIFAVKKVMALGATFV